MGENATLKTRLVSPADSSRKSRPVAASHRRMLLPPAAAMSCPSDEKRATQQSPLERSNGRMAAPAFSRSQTLTVLSALPLTSRFPSIEKPTVVFPP